MNKRVDPNDEFFKTQKKDEKYIWLWYDWRKFMYTKEYSKSHKTCWADLVDNMYSDMKQTNEEKLE